MTPSEIIHQVTELPIVPETARKLIVMLSQQDTHRSEVIQTIRCDNVLTAKVLRVCNSAHCGLKTPVSSIDQALLLLGDNSIFRMVSAIGFGGAMGFSLPGQAVEANGLWSHSLSTGMGAEYLTRFESYSDYEPCMAFTAGLLHDIGKLVLNQILTPKWRAEIRAVISERAITRFEAEKIVLGSNHAEVGACLLQKWALPEIIVEAAANHHVPVCQPVVQLSAVVYLANCAAHLGGTSFGGQEPGAHHASPKVAAMLGLKEERIEQMITGAQGAMKAVNQFMAAA